MARILNNKINNNKSNKVKLPLWFTVLFSVISLFSISSISLYVYQKYNHDNQQIDQEGEIYIQKLGILEQDDVIDVNWLHTLNPLVKKVQGRLLWSSKKQLGVMEFVNLPNLKKGQKFHLWIFDLNSKNNKPILANINKAVIFKQKKRTIMPFKGATSIDSPFKFELMLEDRSGKLHPLLLAQP